jgi:thiol-disulfide isomerase/thioredoxin
MLIPKLEEKFAAMTGGLAGKANNISNGGISNKLGGGLIVGALIGLVWTPCAGPILAVALLQVIQSQTSLDAIVTISAFSIGAEIPMLLIGYFSQALMKYIRMLSRHAVTIRRVMGIIIITFSTMGLFGFNLGVWAATTSESSEQKMMTSATGLQDGLEQSYPALDINGITHWINSEPLNLSALKGKVVLIDFWTYSCINCIRTLPYITSWYDKYKDKGLVVIGVHSPEFAFEGEQGNVESAVKKFGIKYPVAMDNNFSTWKNYKNQYWPAHYLINQEGQVVYTHFGEGAYDKTESNIRYLLGIKNTVNSEGPKTIFLNNQTPETYLGLSRAQNEETVEKDSKLSLHHWAVNGSWGRTDEYIESQKNQASLILHYRAKKVFLVMESADKKPKTVLIQQNAKEQKIEVNESKLYDIVINSDQQDNIVKIISEGKGLRIFAFTFES